MKRSNTQEEKGPVELVDEAFQLLRIAPVTAVAAYSVGVFPFVLGLLYFWSDMARSAFAEHRLMIETVGITFLFLWMKTWQAVFSRQLLTQLSGEEAPRITVTWFLRTMSYQAIVQPLGLFLLPVSLLLLFPLGWVYGFFSNVTVFSGAAENVRSLIRTSWRQARLRSLQSNYVLGLFKLLGFFVFLNVIMLTFAVPYLLKTLLGIETAFSQSPWALLNTTTLAAAACATFVCLDPILKAVYVLRCFYGESLSTGQDLKADLKTFGASRPVGAIVVAVLWFGLAPLVCFAADEVEQSPSPRPASERISPTELDRSIGDVIERREYSWRLPRESESVKKNVQAKEDGFVTRCLKAVEGGLKSVFRKIRDFAEWLTRRSGNTQRGPSFDGLSIESAVRGILQLLLIAAACWVAWLLFRFWKKRGPSLEVQAEALPATPNVADENVGAEQLPEDGWVAMARDLISRGELRLAIRAFYLANLAHLAERNLITLARFKSNRDYERELLRRGHALADLPGLFSQNVSTFERIWYGHHEVTQDVLADFAQNAERLKQA